MESANSPQNGLVYEYADAGVDERRDRLRQGRRLSRRRRSLRE